MEKETGVCNVGKYIEKYHRKKMRLSIALCISKALHAKNT